MSKWLLRPAGVLQIAFAGLHGLMPLGWRTSLAYLTADDRATMYVFNLMTAYVLLVFAYLLLGHARTLTTVGVGRAAVAGMAGFWVLRGAAALMMDSLAGWPLALVCGLIGALIGLPLFLDRPALSTQPRPAAH
jgi:uncharacterized membrane protein HdeD (DUF308 family)